jgi:desampylase
MHVTISRALREEMLALAAAEPEREVCGLLLGEGDVVTAIEPCLNVSARREDSFEIDPAALIAAHKRARSGQSKIVGCYHSHPNGRAELSARDLDCADDGQIWAIIAGAELSVWRVVDRRASRLEMVAES